MISQNMKNVKQKQLTNAVPRQFEVVVIAVYLLDGAARAIDTEDVAIKCHQLAPKLFSWQKHQGQINLELVRVSLSDAKKPKNGALLSGSGREGWRLTSNGIVWISQIGQEMFAGQLTDPESRPSKAGSIDAVRRQREAARLRASTAWQEWSTSGRFDLAAAREIFRVDEYTTEKMLAIKIARCTAMFEHDDQLKALVLAAARLLRGEPVNGK